MSQQAKNDAPVIAGFEFLEVLGSGGFSNVYLYQQKLPRRKVAVKVLSADSLDKASRRQFVAEANLMAQLSSHPAIATIFAANITDDGQPYFIMEYCSGGSLGAGYRTKPLAVSEVLKVGVRIASALESAHRAGIVHRDVKPANILLTDYGAPVLTDFGISVGDDGVAESTMLRNDQVNVATLTGASSSQGMSVPWAPPEAFDDLPTADARSDIYSLGATLFTLLEGRSPFEIPSASNSALHLSRRIVGGELNPSTRDDVPATLANVLRIAMSVLPADRQQTALAVALSLQTLQQEHGQPQTAIELLDTAQDSASELEATQLRVPAAPAVPAVPAVPATAGILSETDQETLLRPPRKIRLRWSSRAKVIALAIVVSVLVMGVAVFVSVGTSPAVPLCDMRTTQFDNSLGLDKDTTMEMVTREFTDELQRIEFKPECGFMRNSKTAYLVFDGGSTSAKDLAGAFESASTEKGYVVCNFNLCSFQTPTRNMSFGNALADSSGTRLSVEISLEP